MSKKPTPKTSPRERNLERRIRQSPRVLMRFGIPQIRFDKHGGRADEQSYNADNGCDPALSHILRARKQRLHGGCTRIAKQTSHLGQQIRANGVSADDEPNNANRDY
jgi:hypothetical protein